MTRVLVLFSCIILITLNVTAQEIVGTAGTTDSIANAEVSWSIGEPIISTGTAGTTNVTQGFVQPTFTLVSVKEVNSIHDFSISIFPNPAIYEFSLKLSKQLDEEVNLSIRDVNGKILTQEKVTDLNQSFQIGELPPATYTVEISTKNGTYFQHLKLVKTH